MKFSVGDVLRYQPGGDFMPRHCREGTAIVSTHPTTGKLRALDTYWGSSGDRHLLTDGELSTAQVQFNLADYDALDGYDHQSAATWAKYAPDDRQVVTSQHGLQRQWFIRKGATEHWPTQIQNAKDALAERVSELESAQRRVEWAREDLARIEAAATEALGVEQ